MAPPVSRGASAPSIMALASPAAASTDSTCHAAGTSTSVPLPQPAVRDKTEEELYLEERKRRRKLRHVGSWTDNEFCGPIRALIQTTGAVASIAAKPIRPAERLQAAETSKAAAETSPGTASFAQQPRRLLTGEVRAQSTPTTEAIDSIAADTLPPAETWPVAQSSPPAAGTSTGTKSLAPKCQRVLTVKTEEEMYLEDRRKRRKRWKLVGWRHPGNVFEYTYKSSTLRA